MKFARTFSIIVLCFFVLYFLYTFLYDKDSINNLTMWIVGVGMVIFGLIGMITMATLMIRDEKKDAVHKTRT